MEASFGFGEAVVSGNVTPDRYLVDKITYEIDEAVISDKGAEFAYNPATKEMEYKNFLLTGGSCPASKTAKSIELTKIAKKVEAHFGCPQDIEYSISRSMDFLRASFLSRPARIRMGKKKKESVLGKKTGWQLLFEKATTPIKLTIEYPFPRAVNPAHSSGAVSAGESLSSFHGCLE